MELVSHEHSLYLENKSCEENLQIAIAMVDYLAHRIAVGFEPGASVESVKRDAFVAVSRAAQ